ncbi:MAG: C39 family peptidase [Oscillospiraceae bacterium]|nr:C39 family peptidase [Oscillospiraceae bacterium]
MTIRKRLLCAILCFAFCIPLCLVQLRAESAGLAVTYLQCDDRWKDVQVGTLTIAQSACSIASICNAVYYLTGREMDLVETAYWANKAGLLNAGGVEGAYRSVFYHSGEAYGEEYGYTATSFQGGTIRSQALIDHLRSGQTAVLHVPGHFMAAIGYDEATGRYLIIDPMPGDVGRYDRRRKGLTHSDGDWLTAEQLSEGYIAVDGYVLFYRALSDREREAILPAVTSASLAGLRAE